MKQMAVKVKINEAFIKKIAKGQKAFIKVDAYADEQLTGEVAKVGMLPDYQNRWMNPDLKVYITMININEVREWLKPGMNARVEILVKALTNVIYIPLQSVTMSKGKHICYVKKTGEPEQRAVEIGEFNDEFIEIKNGLAENELVLLNPPEGARMEETPDENLDDLSLTNETVTPAVPEQSEPTNGAPSAELAPPAGFTAKDRPPDASASPNRVPRSQRRSESR